MATLRYRLQEAAATLESGGILEPRTEALSIAADLLNTSRGDVLLRQDERLPDDTAGSLAAAARQRALGTPRQYVTGRAGFRSLDLTVDRRVLIPRPETEGLVEIVKQRLLALELPGRVFDLGTGSGAIALSLALEANVSRIVATDIDAGALEVAARNAVALGVQSVEFRAGALFEPVSGEIFDAVVSNPPYVSAGEYRELDPGVRLHEPQDALVAGNDGLWHTRRILEEGKEYLNARGFVALEIDSRRASETERMALRYGWYNTAVSKDLFGRARYLTADKEP